MSMGAVLYRTGTAKGSELGGLYKTMPWTTGFCIVGAASISAFPLFSGFVTKSMILTAAAEEGYVIPFLVLLFASAGVFHHSGIKIPFFAFFAHDSGKRPKEAPFNMLLAMGLASFLCIAIGVYPQPLYALLPFPVDYAPYTTTHVVTMLQLLIFSGLAFATLQRTGLYPPELRSTVLDFDFFYRKAGKIAAKAIVEALSRGRARLEGQARRGLDGWIERVFRSARASKRPGAHLADRQHRTLCHHSLRRGTLLVSYHRRLSLPEVKTPVPVDEQLSKLKATKDGLSSAEAAKPARPVRPQRHRGQGREPAQEAPRLLLGADPLDDRDRRRALAASSSIGSTSPSSWCCWSTTPLIGFWQERKAANALAALKKGLAPKAHVKRDGAWATVDAAEPGARRHRAPAPGRDRAGRRHPDRGRLHVDRPGRPHRRIPAGHQAGRRQRLLRLDRQAGRDGRAGHRHRRQHLLRAHRQAGRRRRREVPLPAGGAADRRLPDRHGAGVEPCC